MKKKAVCYLNSRQHVLVKTKQEIDMILYNVEQIYRIDNDIICDYKEL